MEIDKISSRDNARLIRARKVRDGKAADLIFIEGRRLSAEAIRSEVVIEECFIQEGFRDPELIAAVANRNIALAELSAKVFSTITDTHQSQGIVLIGRRPAMNAETIASRISSATLPIVLFLIEINNPSNLGAVFRTAEAAGIAGVILSANSADAYSPKALRAAMGAGFRLAVWEGAEFEEVIGWASSNGLATTAADAAATARYTDADWSCPRLLILGSEAHGLKGIDLGKINESIRIPMEADVESLNLAVSAGIMLFEARRHLMS